MATLVVSSRDQVRSVDDQDEVQEPGGAVGADAPEWGMGAFVALLLLMAAGVVAIAVFAYQFADPSPGSVASVALLLAGASLTMGGLVGFLFGIPQTNRADENVDVVALADDGTDGAVRVAAQNHGYRGNTNLEEVSDWLTKILVGVGLIQLTSIVDRLPSVTAQLKPLLGDADSSGLFGIAVVVCYATCGFLLGFLWSRLFLLGAYSTADRLAALKSQQAIDRKRVDQVTERAELLEQQVSESQVMVNELSERQRRDAEAIELVRRQLNATSETDAVAQDVLNAAIGAASANARSQAFGEARNLRTENAPKLADKGRLARTIPIFRALAHADKNDYRAISQLGYALKDQEPPAWAEAEQALSDAIAIRDKVGADGLRMFEFSRAICRINQDPGFTAQPRQKATPQVRDAILADLRATRTDTFVYRLIPSKDQAYGTPPVEWLELNGIDPTTLEERS